MTRDNQRGRLYTAEQTIRDDPIHQAQHSRYADLAAAQHALDTVLRPAFGHRDNDEKIVVQRAHTDNRSFYRRHFGDVSINLSAGWGHDPLVLAHEYAHHLTLLSVPSHGGEFARTFIDTTRVLLGDVTANDLTAAFLKANIVWRPYHQQEAARRQVLRIRSDVGAGGAAHRASTQWVPFETVIWAEDPDDFVGDTYRAVYHAGAEARNTHGDGLVLDKWGTEVRIPYEALRYVEAPMVRAR